MKEQIINQVFKANELRFLTQVEEFKQIISEFLSSCPLSDDEYKAWCETAFITYMKQHSAALEAELDALTQTHKILNG